MKGFNAEPGERGARDMSIAPSRETSLVSAAPTRARISPVALSMTTIAADSFAPRRATLSFASASSFACSRASIESLMTFACRSAATASSAACAASVGKAKSRFRNRLALRRRGVGGADHPPRGDAIEHAVPRGARDLRRTIRPARFRRLRQRDQKRGLRDGQPQRLLAEIGERGRSHALEIAAERSQREVTVERSRLADVALDLERSRNLPELGCRLCARAVAR